MTEKKDEDVAPKGFVRHRRAAGRRPRRARMEGREVNEQKTAQVVLDEGITIYLSPIEVMPGDFGEWSLVAPRSFALAGLYVHRLADIDTDAIALAIAEGNVPPNFFPELPEELVWERIRAGVVDLLIPRDVGMSLPVVALNVASLAGQMVMMGAIRAGNVLSLKLYNGSDERLDLGVAIYTRRPPLDCTE